MAKVLCIHEVTPEILAIPKETLAEYLITFDDGLYSQYVHWEHFNSIPTTKVYFISPGILHTENGTPQAESSSSTEAHLQFFEAGRGNAFMNIKQIKHLKSLPNTIIGGHSFSHFKEKILEEEAYPLHSALSYKFNFMKEDTAKMVEWFDKELKQKINYFCFPYNNTYDELYTAVVKKLYKIPNTFGSERIDVEDLL